MGLKHMSKFVADPSSEDLPTKDLRWLLAFWNELRGTRELPARADFTPADLVPYLPMLLLSDVEEDPQRFRMRLMGTGIVAATGVDLTGRYYDEVPGTEEAIRRHEWIVENRKPYFAYDLPLTWASRDFSSYMGLAMPLSVDGSRVDMILMYHIFN
jgi:hypothetical protein